MAHFAKSNLCGGPQRQQWQGQQQNNSYNNNYQQAGPSSYNRPAPYQKKFGSKPNYQQNSYNQGPPNVHKGPNWECNQQNCQNKKKVKQLLLEMVKELKTNQTPKSDKKDNKGKGKAKIANLAERTGTVSLEERLESVESFQERVFVSKDPIINIPSTLTIVQEDAEMVSLGDEDPYQTNSLSDEERLYEEFRSEQCTYGADMLKYEKSLFLNTLTNKNHTVRTMEQTVNKNHLNSYHSSSVDTTTNKTVCTVQRVTKVRNENKTALEINKYNELWIIDSGA